MEHLPQWTPVNGAIVSLAARLQCVTAETIGFEHCFGRVLAEPFAADRDSPAMDVSAMDGYAVRLSDLGRGPLKVAGTIPAGYPPLELPDGSALRIFTGAPVPRAADCVVRREDMLESETEVALQVNLDSMRIGQNIRRQGENAKVGSVVLAQGTVLNPPAIAALATFSQAHLSVIKRVRVAVLNTGDELVQTGASVQAWQVRDSNGPLLAAWLGALPWIELVSREHVGDTLELVRAAIDAFLPRVDAILLTGGVSMGDADYVPEAVEQLGGQIAFHGLPIRPGKPVLGASLGGKLILGLPGNPVSVAITSRVLGWPLLARLAGILPLESISQLTTLQNPDDRTLPLAWYRLVRVTAPGCVQLNTSLGSGDLVSLAQSDGFIEVPPGKSGVGPWRLTIW